MDLRKLLNMKDLLMLDTNDTDLYIGGWYADIPQTLECGYS